jgi:hypothetical protein
MDRISMLEFSWNSPFKIATYWKIYDGRDLFRWKEFNRIFPSPNLHGDECGSMLFMTDSHCPYFQGQTSSTLKLEVL